ncbi:hypothetical protein KQI42_05630 [Tissierella sp. MSJ-40]|uniref:DUF3899 domain-containing protein n=1 Tax=Tissierella simiarum TaxID=2841534 RepID=A0ABS6E3J2_9FIRM|nr:hypothetical protein [Tissierella simiarum]MBU5437478.1 hypothetical protein [Tissierella simiarum]
MKEFIKKPLVKIIVILLGISLTVSLLMSLFLKGQGTFIVKLSNSLFVMGVGLLGISVIFQIREAIIVVRNKEIFKDGKKDLSDGDTKENKKIKSKKEELKDSTRILILRRNIFNTLYKSFAITGGFCLVLSFITLIFI